MPPISTRTDTLFPSWTLFRSPAVGAAARYRASREAFRGGGAPPMAPWSCPVILRPAAKRTAAATRIAAAVTKAEIAAELQRPDRGDELADQIGRAHV